MGFIVGPKRIRRLFRLMGRNTIYRRKNLTKSGMKEFIKPYMLRNLKISHANQIWCTDITYIPMRKGFMYMTAIIDVYSRKIVGWGISISMDGKGRALDNVWIERFWKSLKYDYIYLNPVDDGFELYGGVQNHIDYYHDKTHHTTKQTPNDRYDESMKNAA
jgi:putative transposase